MVGLLGSDGSDRTSEKYSFRVAATGAFAKPENRGAGPDAGLTEIGGSAALALDLMLAIGRCGSLSPSGPVSIFNVRSVAFCTARAGPGHNKLGPPGRKAPPTVPSPDGFVL